MSGNETLKNMLSHVFERIVLERRDGAQAVAIVRSHIQAGKQNVMADLKQRQAIGELRPIDRMN